MSEGADDQVASITARASGEKELEGMVELLNTHDLLPAAIFQFRERSDRSLRQTHPVVMRGLQPASATVQLARH